MAQSLFYLEEDDNDNVYGGDNDDNDNDNVDDGGGDLMLRLGNGGSYVTMRKAQLVPTSQRV